MKRIFSVVQVIGGLFTLALMVVTCIDVTGRYLFSKPLQAGYELTGLFLLVAAACGIVAATELDQHIAVDSVFQKFPPKGRRILTLLAIFLSAVVFSVLCWQGGLRAYHAMVPYFEKTQGIVGFITYPFRLALAIGFFLSILALFYQIVRVFRYKVKDTPQKQ